MCHVPALLFCHLPRQFRALLPGTESHIAVTPATTPAPLPESLDIVSVTTKEPVEVQDSAPEQQQLPLDFNRLLSRGGPASDAHASFLAQPPDGRVTFEMEEKSRQFYAGKPEVLQYGQPETRCGARMCEIRLLARGSNDATQWLKVMLGSSARVAYPTAPGVHLGSEMLEERGVTAFYLLVGHRPQQQVPK